MQKEIAYQKNIYSKFFKVASRVWGMKDILVNIYMIQSPDGSWVLIDAGIRSSGSKIKKMALQLFGQTKPTCIILTHGHFDHIGSLNELIEEWNVPIFAHYLELPYLTGKSSYPPPDPSVGGGLFSTLSFLYPSTPINIWNKINVLDTDKIPGLPEWKSFHTPGHTPGHISLYRESDGVLLAGDAFVTTRQESVLSVLFQTKKISGPPKYFTYDWAQARQSVKSLMKLEPDIVATGHGKPMQGKEVRRSLHYLSEHFYEIAVPSSGRYIQEPAVADATGVVYIPPKNINSRSIVIKLLTITAAFSFTYLLLHKKIKHTKKKKEALAYEIW